LQVHLVVSVLCHQLMEAALKQLIISGTDYCEVRETELYCETKIPFPRSNKEIVTNFMTRAKTRGECNYPNTAVQAYSNLI